MIALSRCSVRPRLGRHLAALAVALAAAVAFAPATAWAVWPVNPRANVPVGTQPGNQSGAVLMRDGKGGAFVCWADARSGFLNIYAHHLVSGGYLDPRWPALGRAVAAQGSDQWPSGLLADTDSGVVVVWRDERGGSAQNYAHRLTATGQLAGSWPSAGLKLAATANSQYAAATAADGSGGVLAAWSQYRGAATSWDVVAQRASAAGVRLWDSTGVLVCAAGGQQLGVDVVSDGAGGAVLAWNDERVAVTNPDIYAHRVLAGGALDPAWPAGGRAVCTEPGGQTRVSAFADGAGGAYLAWVDNRSTVRWDLYAHHVRGDGTLDPAWPASGLLLRDSVSQNLEPVLIPDGAGGMLVGSYGDLGDGRILHLRANGTPDPAWPPEGAPLPDSVFFLAAMDSDGSGGAIVAVIPFEGSTANDIFAIHLRAAGTWDPAWPAQGVPVCLAPMRQDDVRLIADGAGGALLAWTDERNSATSGWDVYAQHVNADGTLGHPTPSITSITDVPGDQGGRVLVAWSASEGDAAPNGYVASYLLWRRVVDPGARAQVTDAGPLMPGDVRLRGAGATASWWEYLATIPATRFPAYAYTVATTADARPGETPWNVFVVDAADEALWDFYPSAPDSGYSLDNLAPQFPAPCFGWYSNGTTYLTWPPSPEPDFSHYRLYRLPRIDSPIDETTRIASPTDTGYVDAPGYPCYYAINAVDVHGNSSPNGLIEPFGVTGIDGETLPREVALAAPFPNPARGPVRLRFALPHATEATLRVHDVHGRLVRRLAHGPHAAGWHGATWDGRDEAGHATAPGMYLARLEVAGAPARSRRFVRLE